MGRSLWREDGSVVYFCCWLSPVQSFSGPSSVGLVTIFYCLRFEASFSVAPYDSQGYGGGIRPRLHTDSQSQSYVTTDGQSASLSWCQAPIWGLRPDFYYCQTVTSLLMWGALSVKRTGQPFIIAAGPRQRNYSWVRVTDSFITSRQPEYRSPSEMVPLIFCVICCSGNLCRSLAYELPLLLFQLSGGVYWSVA
jgi:hypothetical protein